MSRRSRMTTVTGVGGSGKTRLVVEAVKSSSWNEQASALFVELALVMEPGLIWTAVADALQLQREGDGPLADVVIEALHERDMLLVLDNCEHIVEGAADCVSRILDECPGVRIVATSRVPLEIAGETVLWLRPLLTPGKMTADEVADCPSVQLLYERAGLRNPELRPGRENIAAAIRLCDLLDGIPLAIELAAGWAAAYTFEDIVRLVESSPESLRSVDRSAPDRHRTMAATIRWSVDLLDPADFRLLLAMSVFAGGASRDAIEAVCLAEGFAPDTVAASLGRLVHCSLVTAELGDGRSRYQLLEPVRQWCEAQLEPRELARLEARHAEFFAALATEASLGLRSAAQVAVRQQIDAELSNFRAALGRCLGDPGLTDAGLVIATGLVWYWPMKGRVAEGWRWLTRLLEREHPADRTYAEACLAASFLTWRLDQPGSGAELATRALEISESLADGSGIARARLWRAMNFLPEGRAGDAYDELMKAEPEIMAAGYLHDMVRCYVIRTQCALASGDIETARLATEEGLAVARRCGDRAQISGFLDFLGSLERRSSPETAALFYRQALELRREAGDANALGNSLYLLAGVAMETGDTREAARLVSEAFGLAERLADGLLAGLMLLRLAVVAQSSGVDGAPQAARAGLDLVLPLELALDNEDSRLVEEATTIAASATVPPEVSRGLSEAIAVGQALAAVIRRRRQETHADNPDHLTPREVQVLQLIAAGHTNAEVADLLAVSVRTVERHISNLYSKTGSRGRADATAYAIRRGFQPAAATRSA